MENERERFKKEFKKRLYQFVLKLIKFLDSLSKDSITQVIVHQLIRSGTSIIGNYIEALSASSKKDFTNIFNHALKSVNESMLWLSLLRDSRNLNKDKEIQWFLTELDEFGKIFASSILRLKGKK